MSLRRPTAAAISMLALILGWCPAVPAGPGTDELVELGRRVEARVSKLRGLDVKKPIRWEVTTKERVRAYVKKILAEQYAPGELEREGLAMQALGLIPPELEYHEFIVSLLEEQVGGYYDPKLEIFYLADWIAPAAQETIIAHELTHALQDQHFDIDRFVDRLRGNSDAMVARAALVEGGATMVMMLYAMRGAGVEVDPAMIDLDGPLGSFLMSMSASQFPEFARAPRALREMLMFPYLKGLTFVAHGRRQGGWKRIDRIYSDLPASTEQVIHPQKYFGERDEPTPVDLGFLQGLVPEGFERLYEDVLGEFMTFQLLEPVGDRDEERRAAAGWDGDRFQVFSKGDRLAWVGWSVWDSEADATEFAGAFAKTVPARRPGFVRQPVGAEPVMSFVHPDGRSVLVARHGTRVLVVDGFGANLAAKIHQAAVGAVKK